jgi:hypothetical protein
LGLLLLLLLTSLPRKPANTLFLGKFPRVLEGLVTALVELLLLWRRLLLLLANFPPHLKTP